MPKLSRYIELEIRDKLIQVLKDDEYISSLITMKDTKTKEEFKHIYKARFTNSIVNTKIAISVFFLGERSSDDSFIPSQYMHRGKFYISVLYQDADKDIAIDECYKLCLDIEHTLIIAVPKWEIKVKDISPVSVGETNKSMFTHVLLMELEPKPHTLSQI